MPYENTDNNFENFMAVVREHMDALPKDTVRPELTRETVLRWNDLAGKEIRIRDGADIGDDGVGAPNERTVIAMPLMISRSEADRLGFTDDDVPNVRIL